ncbi:MAG: agmatine deiminase family protein [Bacteroidetes bacterium]|nr:agmatine deiminase family protein [Bacteroidota bacterium]MBU1580806.1 agmatine deiminase family protein [Bacteroidota bacterium]MBU2557074.1 agmatine deiminase family protein [Bacteroidota bacterium]
MKRYFYFILFLSLMLNIQLIVAQDKTPPDWRKLHYLSEEEMSLPVTNNLNFTETDPPEGDVRMVAEFEPMQAVLIRYPFGLPYILIAEMAEDIEVVTLVNSNTQANQVLNLYTQNGVNTDNCSFIIAPTDSYWTRDYGPWFVFDGNKQPGIVDFPYDRPRPNDNNVPGKVAQELGIELYGMNLVHTGGNMMVDGRGMAASTDLVYDENSMTPQQIQDKVEAYLGVTQYDVTIDPLGDYIKHIDCWGKYLSPDKILIGQVPQSDSRYADYESVANYFATTPSSYGYPYEVYRVFTPGGFPTTPYTNSVILNDKVLVPLSGSQWDDEAIAVYEEAMPGYEIVGINWNNWENTDALHCRAKGIADLGMLFVDHRPVYGAIPYEDSVAISSKIIAYSGESLLADSLLVYYSINGSEYQTTSFDVTEEDEFVAYISGYEGGDTINYYVFAKDETGRRLKQPAMGAYDPHVFIVEQHQIAELTIMPDTLVYINEYAATLQLINQTSNAVVISAFEEDSYFVLPVAVDVPFTLEPGESIEVEVEIQSGVLYDPITFVYEEIQVVTNIGTYNVTLEINIDLISNLADKKQIRANVYPNPFGQVLNISLNLPSAAPVSILLTDLSGRVLETISNAQLNAGEHQFEIKAELSDGMYFLKIMQGKQQKIVKVIKR